MKLSKPLSMLILIASASLLSAVSVGSGNEKHQNQTSTQNKRTDREPRIPAPSFTIVVQPAPVQIIQPSPAVEQKKPQQKWYQRPTITDWGIFVVTILYTSISLGLLNATRQQAKLATQALRETSIAAEAAKQSANAATAAAEAAIESNRQNRELAEHELRAYVHVNSAQVLDVSTPTDRKISVTIKNFGRTPAYNVKFWLGVGVREFPLASVLSDAPADLALSTDILGPGRTSTSIVAVPNLNAWEESQLQIAGAAIYGHGRITYHDIFKREHPSTFRLVCHGNGLAKGRMSADRQGNSLD